MRRCIFSLILSAAALFALVSCGEKGPEGGSTDVQVELRSGITAPNAAGDEVYDFLKAGNVGFATNAGDRGEVAMSLKSQALGGKCEVMRAATKLWCYSGGASGEVQTFSVPSVSAGLDGMVFCTETISLEGDEPCSGAIRPLTSGVVLELMDSHGKWTGKAVSSVTMKASAGKSLAGDITLCLKESRVGELKNASDTISFTCTESTKVGTASLSAVVLPCAFTGSIDIVADGFTATLTIDQPLYLQAGYVKHIQVDMAMAEVEAEVIKHFPYRLAIMGDSISTFDGIIPASHRPYYPTTNAVCSDVDDWKKTYWGHLINDYWHCELDVNTSWSGSCVADGDPANNRTPFVKRMDQFKNPDTIILFGGTNDCQASRQIVLGSFDFDSPLESLNKYARFREAYIWVIRTLQEKFPEAQIICIVGNHIEGEYGNSVKTIADHFGLPVVDFRNDTQVTIYTELHPNAAGHAHMAERIYNETLSLFQ